jgi:cytochrome c
MKHTLSIKFILPILIFGTVACGGSNESSETAAPPKSMVSEEPQSLEEAEADWATNYGIGPVKSLDLPLDIDEALASEGKQIYEAKCMACHKPEKQFIGPAPKGVLTKRTPAWVMNMILNPEEMVQKDPIAKQLLIKFNGSPMANQNLTEEEARAVLEYFRTL